MIVREDYRGGVSRERLFDDFAGMYASATQYGQLSNRG
jgi:hypothetical protein